MDSFFSRYKNGLVLGLVLLAQVIGLAVQVRRPVPNAADGRTVRLLRYWMISVIGPPERVAHSTGLGVRGIWFNYIGLRHARQRARELQAEVDRLRLEQAGLAEDARQGHRLQELLGFKERYIYQTVAAQVIGTSGTDMSRILLIDKGAKDGVRMEMPVITPDGIVGKVREVFPHSAQIIQISDQSSGAGVMLETTRIRGVLRGNAYGQPQIINIMPDDRIQPGERVLTSGGDQVFPRGMTVGYVDKVVADPDRSPYVDVVIRPAATLSKLEEVLVVTNTGDAIPPQETKDVAQSEAEAASRHSAADVLSDKLPGLKDPNDPNARAAQDAAEAATGEGDVARPVRPPSPQHPDRFTPGTTPDANTLTPAQAMPHPPHVQPQAPPQNGSEAAASAPAVPKAPPPATRPAPPTVGEQTIAAKSPVTPGERASATGAATPSGTPKAPTAKPNPVTSTAAAPKKVTPGTNPAANPGTGAPARAAVANNPATAVSGAGTGTPAKPQPPKKPASAPVAGGSAIAPPRAANPAPSVSGTPAVNQTPGVQVPGATRHIIVNDGPDPNRRRATVPANKPGTTSAPTATGSPAKKPAPKPAPATPQAPPPANPATPQGGR